MLELCILSISIFKQPLRLRIREKKGIVDKLKKQLMCKEDIQPENEEGGGYDGNFEPYGPISIQ